MIVTCVTVYVKPENIEDFVKATIENYNNAIQEPGNLRFDFLRSKESPAQFFLYEAYASEEESAAHKKTAHYLKWRDTVADWMDKPRVGIAHNVISPCDVSKWK